MTLNLTAGFSLQTLFKLDFHFRPTLYDFNIRPTFLRALAMLCHAVLQIVP